MRFRVINAFVVTFVMLCATVAYAQSQPSAEQLFESGRYDEAAELYAKQVKKSPNNGMANYSYGVCLYHQGKYNDCIQYLTKAVYRKVIKAGYYLGEAYIQLYQFEDAVNAFADYEEIMNNNQREVTAEELQRVAVAQLGVKMMRGVEQVQVIDSILVDSLSFISYYKLSPQAGRIVDLSTLPEPLCSDSGSIAYMPQRENVVYSSIYNEDNYDLVSSNKLLESGWSEWHPLSDVLNTADNQCYPYMLSDGQTLYFAQDGENSIGGLDIFVTLYSIELEDYMRPQNVGMPFNSLDNDFMMAIDETLDVGWFVTDRNHYPGVLTLYIFIPNATKRVYQDCDPDTLISLARLSSIVDTWSDGADYTQLLDAVAAIKYDDNSDNNSNIRFVLCNGMVYTHTSDFKNKDALRYYNQACVARNRIVELQTELSEMRRLYYEGNDAVRSQLSDMILNRESQLLKMQSMPQLYESRARRAELSFLNLLDE